MTTVVTHVSDAEKLRRNRRKGSYHLVASKNRLPSDPDEQEEDFLWRYLTSSTLPCLHKMNQMRLQQAKQELLRELAQSDGDTTSSDFSRALEKLLELYDDSQCFDARKKPHKPSSKRYDPSQPQLEGMWISLAKPQFTGCLGMNANREFMYTLGRMSFDMFRPTQLVCSIQGTFNPVHVVRSRDIPTVPKNLKEELKDGAHVVRTYDVVTAFSIEPYNPKLFGPDSPNRVVDRRIEGLMTTYGYVLANPQKPNRLSVWWTDGTIEVVNGNEDDNSIRWHKVFDTSTLPRRKLQEQARVLGAKVIMGATVPNGMEEDGRMTYHLGRPIGGHETAYVDILYLDETLRIARACTGVLYVFARVPSFPDE